MLIQKDHYHPLKEQLALSTINEHPLDESSDKSNDPKNPSSKTSGFISPPPFIENFQKKIPTMTQFKCCPKL